MAKGNRNISYFEEQRNINNNPNFFNTTIDQRQIRNNVKRIIKDVAENKILPEDYIYFKNQRVIDSCIVESSDKWESYQTIANAMQAYLLYVIPHGYRIPSSIPIQDEHSMASKLQIEAVKKASIWGTANRIFVNISNGADPFTALSYMRRFDINDIRSL